MNTLKFDANLAIDPEDSSDEYHID